MTWSLLKSHKLLYVFCDIFFFCSGTFMMAIGFTNWFRRKIKNVYGFFFWFFILHHKKLFDSCYLYRLTHVNKSVSNGTVILIWYMLGLLFLCLRFWSHKLLYCRIMWVQWSMVSINKLVKWSRMEEEGSCTLKVLSIKVTKNLRKF